MLEIATHNNANFDVLLIRLFVGEQESFDAEVSLLTAATAEAGATVTLTLTVHALNSLDSNYAVTFLTVVPLVSKRKYLIHIFELLVQTPP